MDPEKRWKNLKLTVEVTKRLKTFSGHGIKKGKSHKKKEKKEAKKEAHPMQAIVDNHGDIKRWKSLEDFDLQAAQQRMEEDKFFHHDKRKPANEAAYHDTGAQSDHSNATSESESERESDEEEDMMLEQHLARSLKPHSHRGDQTSIRSGHESVANLPLLRHRHTSKAKLGQQTKRELSLASKRAFTDIRDQINSISMISHGVEGKYPTLARKMLEAAAAILHSVVTVKEYFAIADNHTEVHSQLVEMKKIARRRPAKEGNTLTHQKDMLKKPPQHDFLVKWKRFWEKPVVQKTPLSLIAITIIVVIVVSYCISSTGMFIIRSAYMRVIAVQLSLLLIITCAVPNVDVCTKHLLHCRLFWQQQDSLMRRTRCHTCTKLRPLHRAGLILTLASH